MQLAAVSKYLVVFYPSSEGFRYVYFEHRWSYNFVRWNTNRKRLTDVLNLSYVNTERLTCTFQIIKDNLTGNADDEVMTNLSSNDPGFHELFWGFELISPIFSRATSIIMCFVWKYPQIWLPVTHRQCFWWHIFTNTNTHSLSHHTNQSWSLYKLYNAQAVIRNDIYILVRLNKYTKFYIEFIQD